MKTAKQVFQDLKILNKSARLSYNRLEKLVYRMPFFAHTPVEALRVLDVYCAKLKDSENELKQLARECAKKPPVRLGVQSRLYRSTKSL